MSIFKCLPKIFSAQATHTSSITMGELDRAQVMLREIEIFISPVLEKAFNKRTDIFYRIPTHAHGISFSIRKITKDRFSLAFKNLSGQEFIEIQYGFGGDNINKPLCVNTTKPRLKGRKMNQRLPINAGKSHIINAIADIIASNVFHKALQRRSIISSTDISKVTLIAVANDLRACAHATTAPQPSGIQPLYPDRPVQAGPPTFTIVN